MCTILPKSQPSLTNHRKSLLGTSQVCEVKDSEGQSRYVAYLIVSEGYGRQKSDEASILEHTAEAIQSLNSELEGLKRKGKQVGKVFSVRINSGLFDIPWEHTKEVLEAGDLDMTIVVPSKMNKKVGAEN